MNSRKIKISLLYDKLPDQLPISEEMSQKDDKQLFALSDAYTFISGNDMF